MTTAVTFVQLICMALTDFSFTHVARRAVYFFSIPFAFLGGLLLKAMIDSRDDQEKIKQFLRDKAARDVAVEAENGGGVLSASLPPPRALFTHEQRSTMLPTATIRAPRDK